MTPFGNCLFGNLSVIVMDTRALTVVLLPKIMRVAPQYFGTAILSLAALTSACAQTTPVEAQVDPSQAYSSTIANSSVPANSPAQSLSETAIPTSAVQQLLAFQDSDVKFALSDLMNLLRDRRHEGWVLTAYPDPKTHRPLIGAGFSLDLAAREHLQHDPLNPHPFLEPSSAELWQAAGLDAERLTRILDQYEDHLADWSARRYRSKIKTLPPEITNEEATLLLRVSSIQAIYNAKAYCRNFDQLTASQQIALSQLVYQMGINLEEFDQFLGLINDGFASGPAGATTTLHNNRETDPAYWSTVQQSLIQSQWARSYRTRAVSVIAMLDPKYLHSPGAAERGVSAELRPASAHRRRSRSVASRQLASYSAHSGKAPRKRTVGTRKKQRA